MITPSKRGFRAAALGALSLFAASCAALISVYTWTKARMPYNDESNFFDGMVVHHAGYEYVYGLLAVAFWAAAVIFGVGAYRAFATSGCSHKRQGLP